MTAAPKLFPRPLITAEQLRDLLADDATPRPVLLCASMGNPNKNTAFIPGSYLADIEAEFSDHSHGVHTAPSPARLTELFAARGITTDTPVVVYDRHGVTVSPRIWYLLKVAGITDAAVLDGGIRAWQDLSLDTTDTPAQANAVEAVSDSGTVELPEEFFADADTVEAHARETGRVIDARSHGRFTGEDPEPREGMSSGHIPGSGNIAFTDLFVKGRYIGDEAAEEKFAAHGAQGDDFIFSCGSGVTACVDALAAELTGRNNYRIYDGSWSEWATSGREIATGE